MSILSEFLKKNVTPKLTEMLTDIAAEQLENQKLYVTIGDYCVVLNIAEIADLRTDPDPRK